MKSSNKNEHLTLQERVLIATGIEKGSSKKAIADSLGKDKSTIAKEIRNHRECTYKCRMPLECFNYKKCKYGRNCKITCTDYHPFNCSHRDRSPGVCNGCSSFIYCRFDKFKYNALSAHRTYASLLVNARTGINLEPHEALCLDHLLKPLIDQGQSIYQILVSHPEIQLTEKTIYTYIELGVFRDAGLLPVDLRRKPSRRMKKVTKTGYKKRKDNRYLIGRKYSDYLTFMELNPHTHVVQMDTVYNDSSNGLFIQTFKFLNVSFLFAVYHTQKNSETMTQGVLYLESLLGHDLFNQFVQVILTDRGSEFSAADAIELRPDSSRRTRLYYCDPMQSGQKGSLENNHIELRYILPKEVDLFALGLQSQNG